MISCSFISLIRTETLWKGGNFACFVFCYTHSFRNSTWCIVAAAKSLQLCPTLCNPRDGSPPGSPVPGTLQARTLEWAAMSFSNAWKWKVNGKSLSRVWLLATPWTAAYQAPPSMGFSRQEYWSGMLLPSPGVVLFSCKVVSKNTGVGCHYLVQGIFPTQGSNLCLLHCRWILYDWATKKTSDIIIDITK